MRRPLAFLSLVIASLVLAACGGSSSSSSSGSSSSAPAAASSTSSSASGSSSGGAIHVTMKNLAFDPKAVHAKVGQTITWTNADGPPHNVTYVSGPKFKSSPQTMNTGATYSIKVTQAGTIQYFCSIHPFMKASIVVSG